MQFDTYFKVTSYAMIASAFLGLALTGELDALSVTLYALAFGVCVYVDARRITRWRLKEWMWRTLTALYIPFMLFDAVALSDKVLALVHLSLFASAAKLYQNKTDRDWVFLYLIAFFQMLLAAGLTFNTTFVASLMAFLFFFISALAAFEIRRTQRGVRSVREEIITSTKPAAAKPKAANAARRSAVVDSPAARRVRRVRYLIGASLVQAVIIIALTLPFFFMIPRFNSANVGSGFGETAPMTGFSDTVELGQVASIKENRRVVMRVALDRQPKKYLRWRGKALEYYDGRVWSVAKADNRTRVFDSFQFDGKPAGARAAQESAGETYHLSFNPPFFEQQADEEFITQVIDLQPLSSSALFATRTPSRFAGPIPRLAQDNYTGTIAAASMLRGRTRYSVISNIGSPTADELRKSEADDVAADIRRFYLQRPNDRDQTPLDPRIRRLAQEITAGQRTNYDKAKTIEAHLKTAFSYTLDLKMGSNDPLAEFLFETKEGHCEYFATAMVMLLRSLDIPARIVNGFQMGEYNDLNDLYVVRESDAHSWVEVYFPVAPATDAAAPPGVTPPPPPRVPPKGYWVEFDPTPSAGINDYSQGGFAASLRKYIDAMEVFWLDYVVTLDREEQASMMVEVQQRLVRLKNTAVAYYKATKAWIKNQVNTLLDVNNWTLARTLWVIGGFCALALTVFAVYVLFAYRQRRRLTHTGYNPFWYRLMVAPLLRLLKRKKRDHQASAVLFYEQMLAIAARAGLVKAPAQTPLEFADACGFAEIKELTRIYNRVRFGSAALEESEARRVTELLTGLKQAVASR